MNSALIPVVLPNASIWMGICGVRSGESIDIAYRLGENEWNGNSTVELKIVDVRPAEPVSSLESRVSS